MRYFLRNLNNSLFKKYLLTTNTVTGGILFSVGDGLSQYIEHKVVQKSSNDQTPLSFNWDRNLKMFVVGAAGGPLHHYFYGLFSTILRFHSSIIWKNQSILFEMQ